MTTVLDLPGTNGNQASAPDTVALSFTGDIDIRIKFSTVDLTPAASMVFVAKWGASNNLVYSFELQSAGGLVFRWSATGSSQTGVHVSSTQVFFNGTSSIAPREPGWVRVAFDVNNGAGGNTATFYTSTDGTTWDELGTPQTVAGTTSLFNGSTAVTVGNRDVGNLPFSGQIYQAIILEGIGGTVRADPDFTDPAQWAVGEDAGDTGSDGVNTWTLGGVATIQDEESNIPYLPVLLLVQAGIGSNPFSDDVITWTDITEDVREVSFSRGRFYELDQIDAGTATLELENFDGKYNANNTTSLYYPNIKPNVPIRIRAVYAGIVYPLWQGYVDRWPVSFPGNIDSLVSVTCSDLFKLLARVRLPSPTFPETVLALTPRAYWRFTDAATVDSGPEGDHTLTVSGTPTLNQEGVWLNDESMLCDTAGDFFTAADGADDLDNSGALTLMAWLNVPAGGVGGGIIARNGPSGLPTAYDLFLDSSQVVFIQANASLASQAQFIIDPNLADASWHQIIVTRELAGGLAATRLYLDGDFYGQKLIGSIPGAVTDDTTIGNGDYSGRYPSNISEVAIWDTVLTQDQIAGLYAAQIDDYVVQRTDERITYLFGQTAVINGEPFTNLDLDVGASNMSADVPASSSLLDALNDVVATERGLAFMTGNGVYRFQNRYYRMTQQATPIATLDETDWTTPTIGNDDDLLANDISVTPGDGEPRIARDETSIVENTRGSLDVTIYPADQNEALDHAHYLLGLYSEPTTRLQALDFHLDQTKPLATILAAELSDRYEIDIPLAGDDLLIDVYLEQVEHTIDLAHNWTVSWQLSHAGPESAFWLLGVTGFSELGTSTKLGF